MRWNSTDRRRGALATKKLLSALLAVALCASLAAFAESAPAGDKVRVGISWVADFENGAPDENIQAYMDAVTKAGGEPVYLNQVTDAASAEQALSGVDCAILTGGEDIGPACYGEEPVEELGEVNDARDVSTIGWRRPRWTSICPCCAPAGACRW